MIFYRLNNDIAMTNLEHWAEIVIQMKLPQFQKNPNWESRDLCNIIIRSVQTLYFLYDHLLKAGKIH